MPAPSSASLRASAGASCKATININLNRLTAHVLEDWSAPPLFKSYTLRTPAPVSLISRLPPSRPSDAQDQGDYFADDAHRATAEREEQLGFGGVHEGCHGHLSVGAGAIHPHKYAKAKQAAPTRNKKTLSIFINSESDYIPVKPVWRPGEDFISPKQLSSNSLFRQGAAPGRPVSATSVARAMEVMRATTGSPAGVSGVVTPTTCPAATAGTTGRLITPASGGGRLPSGPRE